MNAHTTKTKDLTVDGRPKRRMSGQRGASLVIALAFMSIFGLLVAGLTAFSEASVSGSRGFRSQRTVNYAADAALDSAVNRVKADPTIGRDPELYPDDLCNASIGQTVVKMPADGDKPAITVSCQTEFGGGSGEANELGSRLPYALLTLGDRRTDGTNRSLGVRSAEPGPYNGNVSSWFGGSDPCGVPPQETGVAFNKVVYPGTQLFIFPTCASEPDAFSWNVTGNVFSNSKIVLADNAPNAVPRMVPAPGEAPGFIEARGGCFGTGFGSLSNCTDAGWSFADGKGKDPGLEPGADSPKEYGPHPLTAGPTNDPLPVQPVPSISGCSNPQKLVTFEPGIYTDATALNNLFGAAACKNATFWFKPDANGTPNDTTDDKTGTYYFDFRNTTTSGEQCSVTDDNWLTLSSTLIENTQHQWCIGGAFADGYQHVIGGTPFGWSPDANVVPETKVLTLHPATNAGDGPGSFFGLFPQPSQFADKANAKAVDGSYASYAMTSGRTGTSIWLSKYTPRVPRGDYSGGVDVELTHGAINPAHMNNPTVQVDYEDTNSFGAKVTRTCGPYTLPKPPAGGAMTLAKLSTVNAAAAANLTACLNTGDKINSATVRYNVNRPLFQTADAVARLDGAKILVTTTVRPTFPRPPTATDSGGDCDPEAAGVQFQFGGDSRVYVPNGALELCAGPNDQPGAKATGKQIGIYDTPALPRLVPDTATGDAGVTSAGNARSIAEGDGPLVASVPYGRSMALHFAGYPVPSGFSFAAGDKIYLRASYAPQSATPSMSVSGCGSLPGLSGSGGGVIRTSGLLDVTSCINSGGRLTGGFTLDYAAGGSTGTGCTTGAGGNCPALDGVEMIVTLTPDNPNTTQRPASGCLTVSPNLWYGTGTPDCSVVRVDGPVSLDSAFLGGLIPGTNRQRRGRVSVKGAIYAPSASIDIDDEDLYYPISSRGIVTRHLRMRGFKYGDPSWQGAMISNYVDTRQASRAVAFLACEQDSGPCTATIPNPDAGSPGQPATLPNPKLVGRAGVTFQAGTNAPAVAKWVVGRI
jgi:hypothetical protein